MALVHDKCLVKKEKGGGRGTFITVYCYIALFYNQFRC